MVFSPGGTTCNSLGRKPQESNIRYVSAPAGAAHVRSLCHPYRGFESQLQTNLGLTPQAITCRPSGTEEFMARYFKYKSAGELVADAASMGYDLHAADNLDALFTE